MKGRPDTTLSRMGSQTLRLVAEASQGGGDAFEIARVCREIEPGNLEGCEREWVEKAEDTESRAKACLAAGHERSAVSSTDRVVCVT